MDYFFRGVRKLATYLMYDMLGRESNCVIFPAPNPSYDSGVVWLNEDGVKTVILNFLIVKLISFRMANKFLMQKCQQRRVSSLKNVSYISTARRRTLV